MARSTIDRSDCRLVMSPATCGSGARSAKAAPPLKSTSTKASCSGGWVAARPATIVRSSSLLPEPVAPTTRPCGPIPPSAASLRSRTSGSPARLDPDRHLEELLPRTRRQPSPPGPAARSGLAGTASRSRRRTGPARGAIGGGRSSRRGARRRAMVSQVARLAESARMPVTRRPLGTVSRSVANPWSSTRMRIDSSDGSSAVVAASHDAPSRRPAGPRSRRGALEPFLDPRAASGPPGPGGALQASPGVGDRARLGRVEDRQQVRAGAGAGLGVGERGGGWLARDGGRVAGGWVAGVREPSHPLPGRAGGGWGAARSWRSSGAWKAASWQTRERARARVLAGGPVRARTASWRRGTVTGASGSQPARRTRSFAACEEVGVVLGQWAAGGVEPGRGGQGDGAAADPHREEVGVAGAALPEPVGLVESSPRASAGRDGGARRRRAGRRPAGWPGRRPARGGRGSGTVRGAWPGGRSGARPGGARGPPPPRRRRPRPPGRPARPAGGRGRRTGTRPTHRCRPAAPGTAASRRGWRRSSRSSAGPPPSARSPAAGAGRPAPADAPGPGAGRGGCRGRHDRTLRPRRGRRGGRWRRCG